MKIGIGNDHVAVSYKNEIKSYIEEEYGYEVVNFGTDSTERFNYPVAGEAVANAVVSGEVDKGIVICGTGVGIILASSIPTTRAPNASIFVLLCCLDNNAEYGSLHVTQRIPFTLFAAKEIVDAWLSGEYEGGRHQVRIDMLKEIEERQKHH